MWYNKEKVVDFMNRKEKMELMKDKSLVCSLYNIIDNHLYNFFLILNSEFIENLYESVINIKKWSHFYSNHFDFDKNFFLRLAFPAIIFKIRFYIFH